MKRPLFIVAFLLAAVFLHAQRDFGDGTNFRDGTDFHDGTNFRDGTDFRVDPDVKDGETPETQEAPEKPEKPKKKAFPIKNRMVELSFANVGFGFSNNFIAASDVIRDPIYMLKNINDIADEPGLIWQDPIVIDLDRFFEGFKFNFGASIKPFSLAFNWKDQWGFGLDIAHIDITGDVSLSGNMVTASEASQDKFGVGAAAFVDVGVPIFFHYKDFKIKIRPAAYVPVLYAEPKITYTYTQTSNGTYFEVNYDMRVYSLVNLQGIEEDMDSAMQRLADDAGSIPQNNMGYDLRLSVEYPWRYNVDIGLNMVNIPFAAAKLNHYMHLNGTVWADTSNISMEDLINGTIDPKDLKGIAYDYPEEFDPEYKYDADGKKIYRPFAMLFYANYRPLPSRFLTLIPSLGFSVNHLYPKPAAIEGGLSARLDTVNLFVATLGINYNDRKWKNSIDFALNLRAFEFDLGLSASSQDFAKSWQGAGLGVNLGLKFGW